MKKCSSCEKYAESSAAFCPYCGTQFPKEEGANNASIFLKYAEFMDNDELYKVACGMEFGVLREKSEGEMEEILHLLAFRGHLESMFKYAMICLKRDPEDEENVEIAIRWLKIAADAGHEQSKNYLYAQYGQRVRSMQQSPLTMEGTGSGVEGLVRDSLPAIVSIRSSIRVSKKKSKNNAGSGFIIEGGYVITNAHVIGDDPEYVIAKFEPSIDDKSYNLLPLIVDHGLDIAVLKFTGDMARKVSSCRQLQLRLNGVAYGEKVYTIGNPLGMGLSVSEGIVSCPDRTTNYPKKADYVIQTDITINHGNSGGALLDVNNRALGVMTFFPNGSEGGIGMCVPSEYIVKVLNRLR